MRSINAFVNSIFGQRNKIRMIGLRLKKRIRIGSNVRNLFAVAETDLFH